MELRGIRAIRYFSWTNEWLDFVVIVPMEFHDDAVRIIRNAIELFWDGEYEAYGDAVENELALADIPFEIRYIPWNDIANEPMDESAWEAWIEDIGTTCQVTNA